MSYDDDFGGDRGFKLDGEEDTELDEPLEGEIGDMVFEAEEDDDPDNRYH